jgi:ElaB/YqjD/DUF883 family membrane-anchored ribosome-binding protein
MNKAISFLKRIRLAQVLVVFLAGVLLVFNTACSGAADAGITPTDRGVAGTDRPGVSGQGSTNGRNGYQSKIYDSVQPKEGGINEYRDVDPRVQPAGTSAKAKALVDTAKRNVIDQTDDLGTNTKRILDKKAENARDFGDSLKSGGREIRQQTRDSVETARDNVRDAAKDANRNTRRAADEASDYVKDRANEATNRTQRTVDKAQDSFQDQVDDAANSVKRAVDKVRDAID